MNVKRLSLALIIGLLISGSATYMLSRKIGSHVEAHVVEQSYFGPAHPLQAGTIIKAEDVELVGWQASTPLAGAFAKPDNLVGRTLLYPMDKGQPFTDKLLAAPGAGNGLAGRIPEGMRAIALKSDDIVGVAGFLMPDSHVDVLATVHTDKSPEPITFIVLQNAEVLAAGHQFQPDPEGKAATVTVVTLLLSPADAERAVLASLQGSIHFILRSGSDKLKPEDTPVDLSHLVDAHLPPTKTAPAQPARLTLKIPRPKPPGDEFTIETIAGDKQSSQTFKIGKP